MVEGNNPSATTKYFRKGRLLRQVGANKLVYLGVRNVRYRAGNTLDEEDTIDTDIPKVVTAAFRGRLSGTLLFNSQEEIFGMATVINGGVTYGTAGIADPDATTGEVPENTFELEETEKGSATTKRVTFKAMITSIELEKQGERGFWHYNFEAVVTSRPTTGA